MLPENWQDLVVYRLYIKYGLDEYHNYLTNNVNQVNRENLLKALKDKEIRQYANNYIKELDRKKKELKLLLKESKE